MHVEVSQCTLIQSVSFCSKRTLRHRTNLRVCLAVCAMCGWSNTPTSRIYEQQLIFVDRLLQNARWIKYPLTNTSSYENAHR